MNDLNMINPFRLKPNQEAEMSVIGAILLDPDIMAEVFEVLDEKDFLISECRTAYRKCSDFFDDSKDIDFITILAQLGDEYKLFLANCVQMMPSVTNWRSYAQIVSEQAKKARAYDRMREFEEMLITHGSDMQECQDAAAEILECLSSARNDETLSAKEGFRDFYISLQHSPEYMKTGFKDLDYFLNVEPGDYIVIGARPSVGKTAITLQMLLEMSKPRRAVYFSLETKGAKLFGRMAASIAGVSLTAIKTRKGLDFSKLSKASEDFENLKFYTVNAAGWTVSQIQAKAVQLQADIIFIDYIGLIKSDGKGRYEKMTNISIDIATMSRSKRITTFAISQLNRKGKDRPTIEDLRESGQIEQDADAILFLHAPDGIEEPVRELSIAKNKEGSIGRIKLKFEGKYQRFYKEEARYDSGTNHPPEQTKL